MFSCVKFSAGLYLSVKNIYGYHFNGTGTQYTGCGIKKQPHKKK